VQDVKLSSNNSLLFSLRMPTSSRRGERVEIVFCFVCFLPFSINFLTLPIFYCDRFFLLPFYRTYVAGRSIAAIPFAMVDAVLFGTIVYFLVGLSYKDGASVVSYFVFVALMFTVSLTSGLFFSVFSACIQDVTSAQAAMAIIAVVFVLFSGFTVQVCALVLCVSNAGRIF